MVLPPLLVRVATAFTACLATTPLRAQSALPPEPVSLHNPGSFLPLSPNWTLASGLGGDPRREKNLTPIEGTGVLICNPGEAPPSRGHLFTSWEHGDLELTLEFLLPRGSNSGVYLQGRYEVQLFDSWSRAKVTTADCGAIYHRWDAARGAGNEAFDGAAPRANAARAPGLWQKLHIIFEAPRFDAAGKKTKNARFAKVVLNGFTVQENVEVSGPTRAAAFSDEKPLGPLMIQGDHGPVAIRNLGVKRYDAAAEVAVESLRYKLYSGDFKTVGGYDRDTPAAEGTPERFAHSAVEKSGKFALVFTGSFVVPRDGVYRFAVESGPSLARLQIGGREVVQPLDRGSQPGSVTLKAGKHAFRLDLVHTANSRPILELQAEGPGLAPRALTVRDPSNGPSKSGNSTPAAAKQAKKVVVEVKDRVLAQRGFVPFEPRKRLYAISVGTPAGVHYAYDFETASLLRAWRGDFVDTTEMWEGRGNDQLAKPLGPTLPFAGKPTLALLEYPNTHDWPEQPDALFSSQGYTLEADGLPVFVSKLAELELRDRIAPVTEGRGLTRTLRVKGRLPSWSAWLFLAEAASISPQPDGGGWVIGDREWYLDWSADAGVRPVLRTINGKQQLAVPLSANNLDKPVTYSIVW
jgi:hypothetical protein